MELMSAVTLCGRLRGGGLPVRAASSSSRTKGGARMGTTNRRTCLVLLGLGALVGGVTAPTYAQQGSVAGQVTDQATGTPLAGARVTVQGTSLVTSSNAEGRYTLRNVPAGAAPLPATFLGYAAASRALTVGAGEAATADLALKLTPYTLDAVVSTVSDRKSVV